MKSKHYRFCYRVYTILQQNPLTKNGLTRVRSRYEMLCPAREQYIVLRTIQTLLITWCVVALEVVGIIRLQPGILQAMIAILIAIILHKEILQYSIHRMEEKILQQFEQFITDVRHHYYISRMVDDAIFDSLDQTPYEMRVHAMKFYEIITSEHCEELADQYHISSHNNFLNLFLALCVTVVEYGDRTIQDQSLFLINLSNLKTEVNLEILKLKQMNYLYAGLTFVVIAPMTLLKVIEHWGTSNLEELSNFYHTGVGYVTAFVIVLCTLIIYVIVGDLKEYRMVLPKEHIVLEELLQRPRFRRVIQNYCDRFGPQMKRLKKLIDESGEVLQLKQVLTMKFLDAMVGGGLAFAVSLFYVIKDHARYDWYELIIMIVIAFLCFFLPDIRLRFHHKIAMMGREDEMIRYQSIVLMLMYIERISILEILERIEEFSYNFRKIIQNCINNFNTSDVLALQELKEGTEFLPFRRFVDNLSISDEIGVELAFDEVAADRAYFQEKRKQENEMNLNKRFELARFIAYIPAILVIGGYLILPFLIECYRQLNQYQEMMNSLL